MNETLMIKFKTSVSLHWIHRNTRPGSKLQPVHYGADAADVGGMLRAPTQPTCLCNVYFGCPCCQWVGYHGRVNMGPWYCDNHRSTPVSARCHAALCMASSWRDMKLGLLTIKDFFDD